MKKLLKGLRHSFDILFKIMIAAIFIFPFLWMLSLSLQTDEEVARFTMLPHTPTFDSYVRAWQIAPFGQYIKNSLIIIIVIVIIQMLVMVPAAYAFAKLKFKGQGALFGLVMIAFMMPTQVTFIPIYYLMSDLKLMDTLWPQILPHMTNAFGIFLLRQYFKQVPDELLEAARLDNANDAQVLTQIMLPMSKAGLSAIALLSFVGHWNDYFWPLIITNSDKIRPITIGINRLKDVEGNDAWNVIMAGNMFLVLPILLTYLFSSKFIISSFAYNGVK